MISEDVDIRDAEHGVFPILLRCSGVPIICERRPEVAAEAAPKLWWPRCSVQRKDTAYCPSLFFLYVTGVCVCVCVCVCVGVFFGRTTRHVGS